MNILKAWDPSCCCHLSKCK